MTDQPAQVGDMLLHGIDNDIGMVTVVDKGGRDVLVYWFGAQKTYNYYINTPVYQQARKNWTAAQKRYIKNK